MAVDQIARMMALDAAQQGGGGGGGTDNYNDLTNRPKINNVTLTGNKTTSDLGIMENVQADWDETDSTAPSYIQNKPNIPSGVVVDTTYNATSQNAQAGTAVAQAVSTKVDKVAGKGLSENDYTNADKAKLDGIETGAEANVQADWTQTNTTADDYIKNKPTITDVNDAVLTIQKNGAAVGTFSANASAGATINITVPVDADDVNALPDTTKYGASLSLSINSTTYVVTASLKDQDGNTLGTAQTIDLPLETVVVGGSYDDTTKKVVLTLKNGTTVDFSVADLVAGLQTEITSTNKLDADLVDDTKSVHKFVTAADKADWNAKSDFSGSYNDLTDKPTIPAAQVNADWNAVSGVAQILNKPTIPTPVTVDQTYDAASANAQSGTAVAQAISTKVDKETGKGLSTNDFTTTEKNKLSGIEQGATKTVIDATLSGTSTNPVQNKAVQAPVARLVNAGTKNLLKITATSQTISGVTFTVNEDQTVAVNGTNTGTGSATFVIVPNQQAILIPDGDYWLLGCPQGGGSDTFDLRWYRYSPNASSYDTGSGAAIHKSGNTTDSNIAIVVKSGVTVNNITFKPMLCTAEDYAISPEFVPYTPTMRELYEMILALQNAQNGG